MKSLRTSIIGSVLGLLAALVVILLSTSGVFDKVEGYTYDMRVRALAPSVDVPVKIIILDQPTRDWGSAQGLKWPWSRNIYVYLLDYCRRAQVKALAIDVVFDAPHHDVAGDQEFADAVKTMTRYVTALQTIDTFSEDKAWPKDARPWPFTIEELDDWLARNPNTSIQTTRVSFPYKELAEAEPVYGQVRSRVEVDGIIRRIYPLQYFDGRIIPRLSLAAWLIGQTDESASPAQAVPAMRIEKNRLHVGDRTMDLDAQGTSLLHYYRPRENSDYAFEVYSLADVLASEFALQQGEKPILPPDVFKDCYVLFGFTAPGLYDLKPTPFNPVMPGVELHATTLANLIRGDMMSPAAPARVALFALFWSALVGAATARGGRWWWLLSIAVISLALPIVVGVVLYSAGIWWPIVMPLIAALFSVTTGIVYIYTFENRQRRFIRAAFARYLSDEVIEQLVADPRQLQLGGVERELSIFFSDIEGFSSICEDLSPTAVTSLLNDVLTVLSEQIFKEGGTLDKYVGDAVVAFWNAPTQQPDHAARAVRAALRCQQILAEKEEYFREMAGGHPVRVRIGINTGPVLVGNLGSRERFDYSILGDDANLASRLEGANKAFGTHILVSGETWSRTAGLFHGRALGRVYVVGRHRPVEIVQPLGLIEDPLPAGLSRFALAMTLCREGQVHEALKVLSTIENDPTATALAKYLKTLKPDETWDGIWRLTSK